MNCAECNLWWWVDDDEGDCIGYCHADPNWPAPCEYDDDDDDDYEPDYDECGFDPYEGCYTFDC